MLSIALPLQLSIAACMLFSMAVVMVLLFWQAVYA
jgi:hypothetical protein